MTDMVERAAKAALHGLIPACEWDLCRPGTHENWRQMARAALLAALDFSEDEKTALRDAIAPHLDTESEINALLVAMKAMAQGVSGE